MPVLKNVRHERFAQGLAEGKAIAVAYADAGYKWSPASATRLSSKVKERVSELQNKVARRFEVTQERIVQELAMMGFSNMLDYMHVGPDGDPYLDFSALTREQAAALQEVTVEDFKDGRGEGAREVRRVKFKLADKRAALVDLGKFLGMFKDDGNSGAVNIQINVTKDDKGLL